ncbi:MAG: hypothetical protein J0G98_19860, partial [Terrimonas ferruginea]
MRKPLLSFLATFLAMSLCYAQSVTPATFNVAGGSYDNPSSYHRFEWSFGEMLAISTIKPADSAVIVTQGVLQPCT